MDFLQRAAEYFKHHVSVHTFHFTSDGMAFKVKTDAEAHARTLANKEVKTVLRTDIETGTEAVRDTNPGGETGGQKAKEPENTDPGQPEDTGAAKTDNLDANPEQVETEAAKAKPAKVAKPDAKKGKSAGKAK